jgi:hypothetical protein
MDSSGMRADEVRRKLDDESPFEDEPEGEWRTLFGRAAGVAPSTVAWTPVGAGW